MHLETSDIVSDLRIIIIIVFFQNLCSLDNMSDKNLVSISLSLSNKAKAYRSEVTTVAMPIGERRVEALHVLQSLTRPYDNS